MLQADTPDTYVLATGRTETVRRFVEMAFKAAGIELRFEGEGKDEVAIESESNRIRVRVNPKFYRPAEVDLLIGDAGKAKADLGWAATTTLEDVCDMMLAADLKRNEKSISF